MPAPTIAALPTAPSRNQAPDAFTTTADAFVGALSPFQAQINALVAYLNSTAMVLGQFDDGTAAAPSIRFEADQDTGLYRIGANQMGLAQGGVGLGQLFARGNILGTVSQSGGAPTGAIIERGSNANGDYLRLADGTQICWRFAIPGTLDAGGTTWNFPVGFAESPAVLPVANSEIARITTSSDRTTISAKIHMWTPSGTGVADRGTCVFAIGKWF